MGLHVVVVDDKGTITGNTGTLLETHLNLSKAVDAVSAVNSPQKNLVRRLPCRFFITNLCWWKSFKCC
jgi:hypothetical protein